MGAGYHGGFGKTFGSSHYAYGDATFMGDREDFLKNIKNRKDVDINGQFDLIAHGSLSHVEIEHNGATVKINSRVAARLIKQLPGYHGQDIRLLSCNTGAKNASFAQDLANKLNVKVHAPTTYLWAGADGNHFVTGGKLVNGELVPDYSKPGHFKTYYPQRRKK